MLSPCHFNKKKGKQAPSSHQVPFLLTKKKKKPSGY
jgi:hypothetical protein